MRDSGSGISGVRVELYDEGGNFIEATTTDANGDYQFTVVRDGTNEQVFTIREIDLQTDVPTGFDIASVSDTDGANDNEITVVVREASRVGNDFVDGPDFDQDGLADSVDLDDDNDGITDVDEGGDTANTDGTGLPNRIDRDADDDGCPDVIEAGFIDNDGDGQLGNQVPPTVDEDGLVTSGNGYLHLEMEIIMERQTF
ncbi:SdrD B-like domain-containing protein [Nonlabens ponticola]|uniref:SdrD B-like domain-containing protein n=1 Tax=Nonlabens ponticola TaxID=2496866 RepID=UPI0019D048DA|nr:SdrD B-like domain-containing protein [Nonlabens ponticola]